jgi:TPR repeat protein
MPITDGYAIFKEHVGRHRKKKVAIVLGKRVKEIAKDWFEETGDDTEAALKKFFSHVSKCTNEKKRNSTSTLPFSELVDNWRKEGKDGSTVLSIATYYYLYSLDRGQKIAEQIDFEIFGRIAFQRDGDGFPVPLPEMQLESAPPQALLQPKLTSPPLSSQGFHYSRQLVKFRGRDNEKKTLNKFTSTKPGFRWFQLAGTTGQGKSRLAYELMQELNQSWVAGILRRRDMKDFSDSWKEWRPSKPHLIVIDYVLGAEKFIGAMMQALSERDFNVPVCVLLLERQRWDRANSSSAAALIDQRKSAFANSSEKGQADWFSALNSSIDGNDLADEMFRHEDGVVELQNLTENELYSIAIETAEKLGSKIALSEEMFAATLRRIDQTGSPLWAHFLAIALADNSLDKASTPESIITFILDRERKTRWGAKFEGSPPTLSEEHPALCLALLATMIKEVDCEAVAKQLGLPTVSSRIRLQAMTITGSAIDGGAKGPSRIVTALGPSLLGEWFVLTAFNVGHLCKKLTELAWQYAPIEMAAFIRRVAFDFPSHPATTAILEQSLPSEIAEEEYAKVVCEVLTSLNRNSRSYPLNAMRMLRKQAAEGHVEAQSYLGKCLCDYAEGASGIAEGLSLLQTAADESFPYALNELGLFFLGSEHTEPEFERAFENFKLAADLKYAPSILNLAVCFEHGWGCEKDTKEAKQLVEQAKKLGASDAITKLGLYYRQGIGTKQNLPKALQLFEKGANLEIPSALRELGVCYYNALGAEKDVERAVQYFIRAAKAHDGLAKAQIGAMYVKGECLPQNVDLGFRLLTEAAENQLCTTAMLWLANLHLFGNFVPQNVALGLEWAERAGRRGDGDAILLIAETYLNEWGVKKNESAAIEWLKKGVQLQHSLCITKLGIIYFYGNNQLESYELLVKAAKLGSGAAMNMLGYYHLEEHGPSPNKKLAADWFRQSAEADYPPAFANYGHCCITGHGTKKNIAQGIALFRRGVDLGDAHSMINLGDCFLDGVGVEKSPEEAKYWYEEAAKAGSPLASEKLAELELRT